MHAHIHVVVFLHIITVYTAHLLREREREEVVLLYSALMGIKSD